MTSRNFSAEILQSDKLGIVEFGTKWCPLCKPVKKILEELSFKSSGDVKYGYIDAELNPIISQSVGIDRLPQVLVFHGDIIKHRAIGHIEQEELEMLISNIVKKGMENLQAEIPKR